ncbi:probable ubiquitin-like-specific protease 2A isoform X3 [Elaeis guineensis]|uniref:Probable ubiquitin-like-specific protease 2A isoform X2 n=1 Tax=Elaeis guineensis var. tenera TaxID=51953 RepID=A0A6I9QF27_ELAGV|nr:probable ubiquitin-like-specific protease 2A isoform X2 [Elaeis guineensis]
MKPTDRCSSSNIADRLRLRSSKPTVASDEHRRVCNRSRSKITTRRSRRLKNVRRTNSSNDKKLDTNVFESYLEDLWNRISEEKRSSCAYIDCLWFSLYKDKMTKEKVLKWIKRKQIFARKYVFVPIVCWRHWSLLILCHFGGKKQSKAKKPCMLLLDSLHSTEPKRLEPDIRRFVLDIYKSEGRKEGDDFISKIPLLIPKVPQQTNGEECGTFVLYFIYLFLQNAPENFSQEGYPYFLTEEWFCSEDLEIFRKEIYSFWIFSHDCNGPIHAMGTSATLEKFSKL